MLLINALDGNSQPTEKRSETVLLPVAPKQCFSVSSFRWNLVILVKSAIVFGSTQTCPLLGLCGQRRSAAMASVSSQVQHRYSEVEANFNLATVKFCLDYINQ